MKFKPLIVMILVAAFFSGCAYLIIDNEAASVPPGHMRVQMVNDTDIVMCYNVYWINHNHPKVHGPTPVCGGELQPGAKHSFDRNIASWHFEGTRIYGTIWYPCKCKVYDEDRKEIQEKYESKYISEIPEGTAIIRLYSKHYKVVPR